MFGRQDDQSTKDNQDNNQIPDESIHGVLNDTAPEHAGQDYDQPAVSTDQDWQHPGTPLDNLNGGTVVHDSLGDDPEAISDFVDKPAGALPTPSYQSPTPSPNPVASPTPVDPVSTDDHTPNDLIDIKQQALSQLAPLVGHLEQSPEEQFRTTMMMIQASDDQSLVKKAYDAAQNITDEKLKAQALLDIVNEINYFTQHHEQ